MVRKLLENNKAWSEGIRKRDPEYFQRLSGQQAPEYLWIGCSDSRVPANTIVGLEPGEVFVHRNVANVVVQSDLNCMSVLQFAVEVLRVRHVIVCGHYGCGGVRAAMEQKRLGLIDNWLRHLKEIYARHADDLEAIEGAGERADRFCELNAAAQVRNVCRSTVVQEAWARGQSLSVHGLIYGLSDGLLKDLGVTLSGPEDVEPVFQVEG